MSTVALERIYWGVVITLISMIIPTHWMGVIAGGPTGSSDRFIWMFGFVVEIFVTGEVEIYWLFLTNYLHIILWFVISLPTTLLVLILSGKILKNLKKIRNYQTTDIEIIRISTERLFITVILFIVLNVLIYRIPIFGSVTLIIGIILIKSGIKKYINSS
ncbi:MAG: hypothetical protein KGD58_14300 [Candidatus Lokiarchaeota archaeon]|nr:hypothetical protein [Candidatus Lokiarchaeota archaeon]